MRVAAGVDARSHRLVCAVVSAHAPGRRSDLNRRPATPNLPEPARRKLVGALVRKIVQRRGQCFAVGRFVLVVFDFFGSFPVGLEMFPKRLIKR